MIITTISDTHGKHNLLNDDLELGGDIIIHAGDMSNVGRPHEIKEFFEWFSSLNYTYKVLIAGNHDWGFQNNMSSINEILHKYKDSVIYLQDKMVTIEGFKIYGSPWQPEFCDWAFNLPRNGNGLKQVWDKIPENLDILITHGPPFTHLDQVIGNPINLGCELLKERIDIVKPKLHVFGHIHSSHGYKYTTHTRFINASVLDERYEYTYTPLTFDWKLEKDLFTFK